MSYNSINRFCILPKSLRYKLNKQLLEEENFLEIAKQITSEENTKIFKKLHILNLASIFWSIIIAIAGFITFATLMLFFNDLDVTEKTPILITCAVIMFICGFVLMILRNFMNAFFRINPLKDFRNIYLKSQKMINSSTTRFTKEEIHALKFYTLDSQNELTGFQKTFNNIKTSTKKDVYIEWLHILFGTLSWISFTLIVLVWFL